MGNNLILVYSHCPVWVEMPCSEALKLMLENCKTYKVPCSIPLESMYIDLAVILFKRYGEDARKTLQTYYRKGHLPNYINLRYIIKHFHLVENIYIYTIQIYWVTGVINKLNISWNLMNIWHKSLIPRFFIIY